MRKGICIIIMIIMIFSSGCTKSDTKMDVYNSISTSYTTGYTESVTVCLNDEYKDISHNDYIDVSEDIIQRYVNNEYHSTLFSFDDRGYPHSLYVSVKRNKKDYNDIFSFSYHIIDTENEDFTCDIVNDKEKYTIDITE